MGIIIVTGTPGTGKSMLSEKLSRDLNFPSFDIKDEAKNMKLFESVDDDGMILIAEDSIQKMLDNLKTENSSFILHGHLAQYLKPESDMILIVTRCDIAELNERLKARKYTEEKIRDNLDSEIFEVCKTEAVEKGFEPIEFYTSKEGSDYDALLRRIRLTLKGNQSDS